VSVGGLLVLDQVLGELWSVLAHFCTSTCWSKKERPSTAKIMDLTYFAGYVEPIRGPLGFFNGFMGCHPMGFPHV
jgi:hypothetical protein